MIKKNRLLQEKQRLENIIKASNIGTWEWEVQTGKVLFNDAWAKMIGYSLEELSPTIETWYKYSHPEDLKLAKEILDRVFAKELPYYEIELRMKHKNGDWIWIFDKGEVVSWSSDKKPLLMVGSHTNINQIKQSTKELEELLAQNKESEMLLRSSIESPKDMIILAIDKNYNYLYFNKVHKDSMVFAYGVNVEIGMNILECITSNIDKQNSKMNYDKALSGISHSTIQEFGDKEISYYESQYNPIYNDKKEIIGATAFARNISDLMNATTKVIEGEEKLRVVLDSTISGMYTVDENDICTYVNKRTLQLLGYDREEELLGKKMHQMVHHSHQDGTPYLAKDCVLLKSFSSDKVINYDEIIWRKDKTFFPVSYTSSPQIKDGKTIGTLVIFTDRSEKKKLIDDMEFERAKAEKYLNVAGVILIVLDKKGEVTLINHKGCEVLEADEKDILGKNWFDNFLPKELVESVKKVFNNMFDNNIEIAPHYENEVITTNGEKKIINWYNTVLYDNEDNIIGILSSGEDITQKKHIEYALSESKTRFQLLFNSAPIGYQSLDINGCFREVNQTWLDILGYQKEEVIGKWFGNFLTPEYREPFKERFEFFKQQGKIHSEFEMVHKKGTRMFFAFDGTIGYTDDHQFVQTYCTLNDITQRKKMEEELRISENNLKLAQSIAKIGSWELYLKDSFIWASDEAFNIYGLEKSDNNIDLSTIQNMVDPVDREKLDQALTGLIAHDKPYDVTFKLRTEKGIEKYINSKASLFTDEENKPLKVVGVIHDITDEKHKELELEYLSQRDYLTDLYNRRYYFEQFKYLDNPSFYPLGVMMLDVNGLKIINDAFGHSVGDTALITLGNVLKNTFEQKDIISRIGGDEFTVLLPNTSAKKLQEYKEQIVAEVKRKRVENVELSLAIGYEIKNTTTEDIDDMQKLAENHMYRHKTTEGSSVRSRAINAILVTLTNKYETERRHSAEVSHLCKQIGIEMNLRADEIKELEQAGLFHDIGKISIPDIILNKPGKLTTEEFEIIKSHTEVGYQILRAADEFSDLAIHALHHHERWDGTGYPSGLKGTEIPLFSRIINIVDAYEAMTADRPYRKKLSQEYAITEIARCASTQFDPKIAQLFVEKVLKKNWDFDVEIK